MRDGESKVYEEGIESRLENGLSNDVDSEKEQVWALF